VLNVAQMFAQLLVIGLNPALGVLYPVYRHSCSVRSINQKDGENRRKTAKDTKRHAKDVLASFVNKRWAMKDDKKTTSSNETQRCYCKPSALLLQLTVTKY